MKSCNNISTSYEHVFKMEQAVYKTEEIDWSYVEFVDNQDVLDLIEKKPGGIISLLDEACMFPRSTHETFAQKLYQIFKDHRRFVKPKLACTEFTVVHYSVEVQYLPDQFLDKNKDYVVTEHQDLLSASQCSFVAGLFPQLSEETAKSGKFSSIGSCFKVKSHVLTSLLQLQLQQLMDISCFNLYKAQNNAAVIIQPLTIFGFSCPLFAFINVHYNFLHVARDEEEEDGTLEQVSELIYVEPEKQLTFEGQEKAEFQHSPLAVQNKADKTNAFPDKESEDVEKAYELCPIIEEISSPIQGASKIENLTTEVEKLKDNVASHATDGILSGHPYPCF
ncbi:hypothetical protein CRYUN_Cryun14cG0110900 [Craigia yunnanensis]